MIEVSHLKDLKAAELFLGFRIGPSVIATLPFFQYRVNAVSGGLRVLAVTPLRFATLHLHPVETGLAPVSCRTCTAYKTNSRSVWLRLLIWVSFS
jgi:hypothetical protein